MIRLAIYSTGIGAVVLLGYLAWEHPGGFALTICGIALVGFAAVKTGCWP